MIAVIEDVLIGAMTALNLFAVVDSVGRDKEPPADAVFDYPYASVFFLGDSEVAGVRSRPVDELLYGLLISAKNVAGEKEAAADAYALIDAARGAVRGKTLGVAEIEPFVCRSRELISYEDGIITYLLIFATRKYQQLVAE